MRNRAGGQGYDAQTHRTPADLCREHLHQDAANGPFGEAALLRKLTQRVMVQGRKPPTLGARTDTETHIRPMCSAPEAPLRYHLLLPSFLIPFGTPCGCRSDESEAAVRRRSLHRIHHVELDFDADLLPIGPSRRMIVLGW